MLIQHRVAYALIVAVILIGAVGCETATTTRTGGVYVDDARIAADVRTKLLADPTMSGARIGVTSSDGVVYLTGTVPSSDRLTRATELTRQVNGVRSVVNNMAVATAPPTATTVMAPPPPPVNIVYGQPAIDVTGIVAQYDPQNGILTFQDGRMVRVTTVAAAGGPASTVVFQPGSLVTVRSVQPIAYQPPTPAPAPGAWRMGTVNSVDVPNGLIFLTDGSVVHVGPSTILRSGTQPIMLAQLQPGSQIAISVPPSTTSTTSTTVTTVTPAPPPGSVLPRQTVVPLETREVQIFVVPR